MRFVLFGAFPRSETLVEATRGLDRGRVTVEEVERIRKEETRAFVERLRELSPLELVPPMLSVQDLFRPFAQGWEGVRPGPLTRWFDNNTFFRKPIFFDRPVVKEPVLVRTIPREVFRSEDRVRITLPGPGTFAGMAEDTEPLGQRIESLLTPYLDELNALVEVLPQVQVLQFQEPWLAWTALQDEAAWEALNRVYETLRRQVDRSFVVHVYFRTPAPIWKFLVSLPVDAIGLDFYSLELDELPREGMKGRTLQAGLVDARNSLLESLEDVHELMGRIQDRLAPSQMWLSPTADLEFLPAQVAWKKLDNMARIAAQLDG